MMEKYGAEIPKYEVVEVSKTSSEVRVVGTDLTMEDASKLAKESIDYVVRPL